jgi:hypothetical protein
VIDGRVMYQARPGDRWSLVDDAVVARMFRTFDGLSLDVVGTAPVAGRGSELPPTDAKVLRSVQ